MRDFYRPSCGPGWALAGDTGFHKDPIVGDPSAAERFLGVLGASHRLQEFPAPGERSGDGVQPRW